MATTTVVNESDQVIIPSWVVDLTSFRRWTDQDDFPDKAQVWFLMGEVWVDMSKEQVFSHNQVKTEFTRVLGGMAKAARLGLYSSDGLRLTSEDADFSGLPDGTFASTNSLREGQARLIEGKHGDHVEVEGTPDMVLEILSDSSIQKDTVVLRKAYGEAGIPEYWLVDARGETLRFDIFRHTEKGYVAVRKQGGWLKSGVFGKPFRLIQQTGPDGYPEYTLDVR